MAIADAVPELDVTIEVHGTALPECDYQETHDHNLASSSVKYVAAPSGVEFAIRYLFRPPFTPPSDVLMDILFDDKYIQGSFFKRGGKDGCEEYLYSKTTLKISERDFTQRFRLLPCSSLLVLLLTVFEEELKSVTEELCARLASTGCIALYFYFIEYLEAVRPAEVEQLATEDFGILSEKALYKGASTPGDIPSDQTNLTAPEHNQSVNYNHFKTISNELFAKFTFYYRSTDALKSIGVIPRTPSPSPAAKSEAMIEEEMMAGLKRVRVKAIRLKRERQDSESTLVGDDEVEWPLQRCAKRVRCGPGADDEVVSLED
ncbi:hypothetical protein EJ02DRAFT_357117 [Clathrospora elynae]|uniref:DUF7918 domain-containing protein n=1 Tax=Clathrospora elynae TaxID=706981 RepID=A0A6A5SFQ5_9PLEO|nr:hypothetical protein EJ02DRAFT_357117 [Clathrospora elynae]